MCQLLNPTLVSTATMLITSQGTGAEVATLKLQSSSNITLTLDGTAVFTDSGGNGTATTYSLVSGALRTFYIKCPSGTANLTIPTPTALTGFGSITFASYGWSSTANGCKLTITPSQFVNLTIFKIDSYSTVLGELNSLSLADLHISGNATYTDFQAAMPSGLLELVISGVQCKWTYSGALPTSATYIIINGGSNCNWTGLDVSGTGNITTFSLQSYRINKMSSADMLTLLASLTNRVGTLPATITINEYADYASPPQTVVDAVAALKIAKSITTVNLGA